MTESENIEEIKRLENVIHQLIEHILVLKRQNDQQPKKD